MKKIAKFMKVSKEQFVKDFLDAIPEERGFNEEKAAAVYDAIQLPKRATSGSAGYDFFSPVTFTLHPGQSIKLPTGIRAKMEEGWVLSLYPRSGLGFKYRMQLNNTVGIIDSDYFNADNEGHIICRITNDSNENKSLQIEQGKGFVQGIFTEFGICEDDDADGVRTGGFGSTTK